MYDVGASPILNHWQQLLASEADDIAWMRSETPFQITEIVTAVSQQQKPGDQLIFVEPDLLYDVLEADLLPAYGLPYNINPDDELAQNLFTEAVGDAERLWLITWYPPGDPANWYEASLRQEWASISDGWLGDYRLLLFAREPETAVITPKNTRFESISLAGNRIQTADNTLFVTLVWQAEEPLVQDYVSFVHVVSASGQLIAQQDRPPLAGYRPTSSWQVGESVVDRFAFVLPPEQLAEARVVVGWYEWPSLARLTLADGADAYELR